MANQSASGRVLQQARLSEMASLTGGAAFFPVSMKELDAMYARIAGELHAQYTLGYLSTNTRRNGSWRKVSIHVDRPGTRLNVRTREGYFAPSK